MKQDFNEPFTGYGFFGNFCVYMFSLEQLYWQIFLLFIYISNVRSVYGSVRSLLCSFLLENNNLRDSSSFRYTKMSPVFIKFCGKKEPCCKHIAVLN